MSETLAAPRAPDHVPEHLVRDFRFEAVPGVEDNSIKAAAEAVRGGPEIFFGLRARRGSGAWVLARHELIREVMQDTEVFSSRHNADFSLLIGEDWPIFPLEADPPHHAGWRILLNPIFSPGRMKVLEAQIEELAVDLVEGIKPQGGCDFVKAFCEIFPIQIFLRMFGLPLEHTERFLAWEAKLVHGLTQDVRAEGARAIVDYLRSAIAERRAAPRDDLVSYVVGSKIEGRDISDDEAVGVCLLLYVAGLDTVANMLGFMFKHLAENPADQQLLRDEPALIPNAIEELLRAYPIVVSGRMVTRDVEFHGVKMKAGDTVALASMLAGRDGREFEDPDRIDFRREKVSHITFGAGPHRCVGSHLARRELRIALETWLQRIPPFRIAPGEQAVTHGVGVFGVSRLPLVW